MSLFADGCVEQMASRRFDFERIHTPGVGGGLKVLPANLPPPRAHDRIVIDHGHVLAATCQGFADSMVPGSGQVLVERCHDAKSNLLLKAIRLYPCDGVVRATIVDKNQQIRPFRVSNDAFEEFLRVGQAISYGNDNTKCHWLTLDTP